MRNNIPLLTWLGDRPVSNFRLYEFESNSGFCMIHPTVLLGLELVRRDLAFSEKQECAIIVTGGTRTDADNAALGARLGWIDEGGVVSRDSRHLAKYGGIAVDFYAIHARDKARLNASLVGVVARRHFDFVKDDYKDGHIHADQRTRGA